MTKVFVSVTYVARTERGLWQRHQNQFQCKLYDFETCDSGDGCRTNAKNRNVVETRDTSQNRTSHSSDDETCVSRKIPIACVSQCLSSYFCLIDCT